MTPVEIRSELLQIAAEMARGLHADVVYSETTPRYVQRRVDKVIDDADERAKVLAIRLREVADNLSVTEIRCPHGNVGECLKCESDARFGFEAGWLAATLRGTGEGR